MSTCLFRNRAMSLLSGSAILPTVGGAPSGLDRKALMSMADTSSRGRMMPTFRRCARAYTTHTLFSCIDEDHMTLNNPLSKDMYQDVFQCQQHCICDSRDPMCSATARTSRYLCRHALCHQHCADLQANMDQTVHNCKRMPRQQHKLITEWPC